MSPVAPASSHAGRALAVGSLGVGLLFVGVFVAAVFYSRQDATKLHLGDQTFQAGKAKDRADEITRRGPFIVADASPAHRRDIIVAHLGGRASQGWYAFAAQPAGKPRTCTWQWQRAERQFRAKCDRSLILPADGRGADQYLATVDSKGRLSIDLNAATRPKPSAETTTTVLVTGNS